MIFRKLANPPASFILSQLPKNHQIEINNFIKNNITGFQMRSWHEIKYYNHQFDREFFALFDGKCVYCEIKLRSLDEAELERYRPHNNAIQDESELFNPAEKHYMWLTWEWSNLYLACKECVAAKRALFPIREDKKRAVPFTYDAYSLCLEEPYLLNPSLDNPLNHLDFDDSGHVKPKQDSKRGEKTINILELNKSAFGNSLDI